MTGKPTIILVHGFWGGAAHWSKVQAEEMDRVGIFADWKNPYSTMDFKSEATIAAPCIIASRTTSPNDS